MTISTNISFLAKIISFLKSLRGDNYQQVIIFFISAIKIFINVKSINNH